MDSPDRIFEENRALNEKEIGLKSQVLASRPRLLMIVLTSKCNLRCIMCKRYSESETRQDTLPFEIIKQIYGLFPYLEGINWQGGEVFLVDYFKDLFIKASERPNILQSIITNGLFIDEEWAEIIARSRVNLGYSIDAVTRHTYESIRRGARFDDLLESVDTMCRAVSRRKGNANLFINTVVMRSNYRELHLFPQFCNKFGFKHLRFDFCSPDVSKEDIVLKNDNGALEFLRDAIGEVEQLCSHLKIGFDCTFKDYIQGKDAVSMPVNKPREDLKCKLPWKKLFIDASDHGSVRPGCLCSRSLGSIMDTPLEELWNNETMRLYRVRQAKGDIEGFCSDVCLKNLVDRYEFEGVA